MVVENLVVNVDKGLLRRTFEQIGVVIAVQRQYNTSWGSVFRGCRDGSEGTTEV